MELSGEPLPPAALEVAFDAVPLPLALVDAAGTLRRVNPALGALLGYTPADLVGRAYADLTPAEDVPLDVAATQRLLHGRESSGSVEKRLLHRDGRPVWVRVSVTAVRHDDGSVWGGVARVEPLVPADPAASAASTEQVDPARSTAGYWSALHDPLTGAANRLLLSDRITLALAATKRDGGVVAVLFCDLDDFKALNDTFGHERGDQVLTAVVRRLQTALRPDDTVARLGGDEFVVAAHVDSAEHAADLLDRVRAALNRPLGLPADPELTVGVSVGLAFGGPGSEVTHLLADADRGMYAEKSRRRTPRPRHPG